MLGAQFSDVYLPPATAAWALKSGACVPISDPRRKQLHGAKAGEHPRADLAADLDATEPTHTPAEPERHSAFTVVDRGGPLQLKVAR